MSVLERTPGSRVVVMDSRMAKSFTLNLDDLRSERYQRWTAHIRTKVATESFGHELASRLAASGSGVSAIVVHPGRGLDARTPDRPGVFEKSAAQQLFRPIQGWAGQGKDRAAWSMVRAATDPEIVNGQDGDHGETTGYRSGASLVGVRPIPTPPHDCGRCRKVISGCDSNYLRPRFVKTRSCLQQRDGPAAEQESRTRRAPSEVAESSRASPQDPESGRSTSARPGTRGIRSH